jgi:hypothetical protein
MPSTDPRPKAVCVCGHPAENHEGPADLPAVCWGQPTPPATVCPCQQYQERRSAEAEV